MVLVFRELPYLFERFCKLKKTKRRARCARWKQIAGRLRAGRMFDEGHPFGRVEPRRATKKKRHFPILAQPTPQGAPAERKRRQNQACPARRRTKRSVAHSQ